MTSRTNVCEPKPRATPITPAPASSGATFTPISASTLSVMKMVTTKPSTVRSMGSSVRTRAERAVAALAESRWRWRAMAALAASHTKSASSSVMAIDVTEPSSLAPPRP